MRPSAIHACAAVLLALTAVALMLPHQAPGVFGIGYGVALDRFVAIACVQGVVYGIAVWLVCRGQRVPLAFILGIAALLRAMVLCSPPFLSNDLYRYIWDGRVIAHGINPYRYIPADAHLAFLRDAVVYPNINRATYAHTIYPPAAELAFFIITRIGAVLAIPPALMMCLGMVAFEAVAIWAMLRMLGAARSKILIYAWNPLAVWEFAGNGHVDAIAVCFVALALLAARAGRRGWSAAALALAVLAKFLPLVLLPALWRRWDWKFSAIFAALLAGFYLPFLGVGFGVFGFLGGYAAQEHLESGGGIFLASLLEIPATVYFVLFAFVLLAAALMMVSRPGELARRTGFLMGLFMLGLSPHYPWYYVWLLVPGCLLASPSLIYLSCAAFLLYLNPTHTQLLWPAFVFLPFVLLGLIEQKFFGSFFQKRTAFFQGTQ